MSFINDKIKQGRIWLNPITDDWALFKASLNNGKSFNQIAAADAYFEDVGGFLPNAKRFTDGGSGYAEIEQGNLCGFAAFKKAVEVQSSASKNINTPAVKVKKLDGTVEVRSFPFKLMPGEDLLLEGTSTSADNYIGVFIREARQL